MTTPVAPATDLTEDKLGRQGALIGSGGQAKIYQLPDLKLPDVHGALVYKKYKPGKAPAHSMSGIVSLRTDLRADPVKLAALDTTTAWPVRQVVAANGGVLGLVLARIPDSFFHELRLPSGNDKRTAREVQFLFIPPDRALRTNLPTPTPTERLTICRDFAGTLSFLHRELNVVFGDINARNAVFRLGTEPTVMFVDCDAVRKVSSMASVPQLDAPDWQPPEGSGALSLATDRYKLGLFVLRCLTPDVGCSVNTDPNQARGVLDVTGLNMLNQAIRGPADRRPTAEMWHRYLRRALGEALAPPRLDRISLDRTIVAAGEPITLTWSADEADTVAVTGAGLPTPVSESGIAGSGTIVLRPARTGRLTVTVRNQLGEDSQETNPVAVYDVPTFQDLPVPMPRLNLPDLGPRALPAVAAVLPELPTGTPLPLPPMVNALGSWIEPDMTAPDFIDMAGPPPAAALGIADIPVDISAIMSAAPDHGANSKKAGS